MELRSSRQRNEYKELQLTLSGMGFYEEGMELQEMRQILDALQMSVTESETNFLECDVQQAIRESELDFLPSQNGGVFNSTMVSVNANMSPSSSPEIPSQRIIIEAEVHHPMNWSPSNEHLPRKHITSDNMPANIANGSRELEINNHILKPNAKHFYDNTDSITTSRESDLMVNIPCESTFNSIESSNHNNVEHPLQVSNNSSNGILSPVTVRKINDSGLNISSSHSSFDNNSNENTCSVNNLENSLGSSSNIQHEIRGPVSMRRILDSGVNVSIENYQSSLDNSLNENTNTDSLGTNSIEGLQASASSVVNPDIYNNDLKPSIEKEI